MIRVGICDDEQKQRNYLKQMCEEFFHARQQTFECVCFSSGEGVLLYEGKKLHVLFLDIEMGSIDGIQVLKELEHSDKVWRIVFVSSHDEEVWNTFGLKTLGFIRKPVLFSQIEKWLQIILNENQENVRIECDTQNGRKWIRLENLYYIKAQRNYVYFNTGKGTFLVNRNLKSWEESLSGNFVLRVHKSYLVNLLKVEGIGSEILLKNGEKIPVGRQYKIEIVEKYNSFIRKRIRDRM